MASVNTCPQCGKNYKPYTYNVKGFEKTIFIPDCECTEQEFRKIEKKNSLNSIKHASNKILQTNILAPLYEKFDFTNIECTGVARVCEEFAHKFSKNQKTGLAFIGLSGRGKSVLLACICKEIGKRGFCFLFINTARLLDIFIQSLDFSSKYKPDDLFKILKSVDFIVLDDFGRDCFSTKRKEFLFRITDELAAYEKCVSISANPDSIAYLKSIPDTDGIFDRLAMLCPSQYIFNGKSFRRDTKENYFKNLQIFKGA